MLANQGQRHVNIILGAYVLLIATLFIVPKAIAAQEEQVCHIQDTCQEQSSSTCTMSSENESPIQVFVLLGQSNMLGFGTVGGADKPGTLEYLMEQQGKYPHLKDADGNWFQSPNVRYVQAMFQSNKMRIMKNDWLRINNPKDKFGPELGFGVVMGPYMKQRNQRILIVKSCIGNRSLGWDLLPPGSPQFQLGDMTYAGYKDSPMQWKTGTIAEPIKWYAGKQYDDDIGSVKNILDNIGEYYPDATPGDYQVAGFLWWQGQKDQNEAHASKYEENLVRLIHALRKDFDAPKAKFVCATVAFEGMAMKGHCDTIRQAQLAVSGDAWRYHGTQQKYPEFRGNVLTIDARPFWRPKEESPANQGHHYHQNGETYYEVGHAMGQAMKELLQREGDEDEE